MQKNITNKRGRYKTKEIDAQYSFVEVGDLQERIDSIFDPIFLKIAQEFYEERQKALAKLVLLSDNDNNLVNNFGEIRNEQPVGISNR
ncbi:hypothetical protein HYV44_02690 [Candidatus Microgenomates bacterium]|nr:hypothetical protein [Candidatus Microgenomates bacterium]